MWVSGAAVCITPAGRSSCWSCQIILSFSLSLHNQNHFMVREEKKTHFPHMLCIHLHLHFHASRFDESRRHCRGGSFQSSLLYDVPFIVQMMNIVTQHFLYVGGASPRRWKPCMFWSHSSTVFLLYEHLLNCFGRSFLLFLQTMVQIIAFIRCLLHLCSDFLIVLFPTPCSLFLCLVTQIHFFFPTHCRLSTCWKCFCFFFLFLHWPFTCFAICCCDKLWRL